MGQITWKKIKFKVIGILGAVFTLIILGVFALAFYIDASTQYQASASLEGACQVGTIQFPESASTLSQTELLVFDSTSGKYVLILDSIDIHCTVEWINIAHSYTLPDSVTELPPISTYTWNKSNCLTAKAWGMDTAYVPLFQDAVFIIEASTGYIWKLNRIK